MKLKSAEQLLTHLIALVKSFNLQRGIETASTPSSKRKAALSAAKAKDKVAARRRMIAPNNEVQTQRGKALTEDQANQLTNVANQIGTGLGCLN